jgi:hypothetical protein
MSKYALLISLALFVAVYQIILVDLLGPDVNNHPTSVSFLSPASIAFSLNNNSSSLTDANVRILLFVTTIYSQKHQNYFKCCWPKLMEKSQLLKRADVMIFSNNMTELNSTTLEPTRQVFESNNNPNYHFEIKFATNTELQEIRDEKLKVNKFQRGANLGVKLGVSKQWFAPYDWVIRINPDVLIRNSTWIWETMQDSNVDGIFIQCHERIPRIHTDFFAVRPRAMSVSAFAQMEFEQYSKTMLNHEITAHKAFQPILESNRYRYLPDVYPSNGFCRARGLHSPVYHAHDSCRNESMICDALEGHDII